MTDSVHEAQLKKTDADLVVESDGWFVFSARDVPWWRSDEKGQGTEFEGKRELPQLGFHLHVLMPGQHGLYHGERGQEDFLVVSGECLLVIEGEERRLRAWDFVHCPPWTQHVFVDHAVSERYGVWVEKSSYGRKSMGIKRSTFVLDADGNVVDAGYGVKPDTDARRVLEALPE